MVEKTIVVNNLRSLIVLILFGMLLFAGCASKERSTQPIPPSPEKVPKVPPTPAAQTPPKNLCGNGAIDLGERCSSCPSDVLCSINQLCCSGACTKSACNSTIDCDDKDDRTIDACLQPNTCAAQCANQKKTEFTLDEEIEFSGAAKLKISNVSTVYTNPNPFYDTKPNVKWVMFDVYFENVGGKTVTLSSELNFNMIDSAGREFEVYGCYSDNVPPDSYVFKECYGEISNKSNGIKLEVTRGRFTRNVETIYVVLD